MFCTGFLRWIFLWSILCVSWLSFMAVFFKMSVFVFLSSTDWETATLCHFQVYIVFCIGGTVILIIALLSVNHYFCVVKYTLYDRVFTFRNTVFMLSVLWPILLFPVLEKWGHFEYMTSCGISTVHISEMDLASLLFLNIGVSCSPHFCYNEILRKVNSTKVNSLQSENLRNLKDKSLIQSIFCFITVYAGMHLPPLFTGFYYRFLYDKNTHMGWSCCSPHMNVMLRCHFSRKFILLYRKIKS